MLCVWGQGGQCRDSPKPGVMGPVSLWEVAFPMVPWPQGGAPGTQPLSSGTTKPLSGRETGIELAGAESSNFTFDCGAKLPGSS